MKDVIKKNLAYWKRINGCSRLPGLKIVGEDNFVFYKGQKADLVFRDA